MLLGTLNAKEVSLEAKISGLYIAFFNRAADEGGLTYWTQRGEAAEANGEDVSDVLKVLAFGFAQHPSFERAYGAMNNKAFVEAVYRNTLGRDGDIQGVAYWSGLLDRGMSRSDFVSVFVEAALTFDRNDSQYENLSQEELDAAQLRQDLLANKVEIALQFTRQLGTSTNVTDIDKPEEDPAYLASIKIISEVTESKESVQTVKNFLSYMQNNTTSQISFIQDITYISAPVAKIDTSVLIHENETVTLDAAESVDFDGNIVRYEWKEGDKILGVGRTLSNIQLLPGQHTITLIVTDNDGKVTSTSVNIRVNHLPTVVIEGNLTNIWGVDAYFDGTASNDLDGHVVDFLWSNGEKTKKTVYENLPLGRNKITLSVTDNDGGVTTESKIVNTIMCAGQEEVSLLNDVNGTVNVKPNTNHVSCYKLDLSSNNSVEKYTFYMNLYEGTTNNTLKDISVKIYDQYGTEVKKFDTELMDGGGDHMKEQFSIDTDGTYYIEIYRKEGYVAKYGFSIHPSLENGLVQDDEGEMNDFMNMATPLTLNANNTLEEVEGTLNMTRKGLSSIKNTDDKDWYSFTINASGTYSFYMNLYEGTTNNTLKDMSVKIYDQYGTEVKNFDTQLMDYSGDHMKEQFRIDTEGTYYMRFYRKDGYAAKYGFGIDLPN
jgi:hypothetical protein